MLAANESAADRADPQGVFRMVSAAILGLAATTLVYGQWRDRRFAWT